MNPSIPVRQEPPHRKPGRSKDNLPARKPGMKRIFPRDDSERSKRSVSTDDSDALKNVRLKLNPDGPELQVHSVRMRSSVDTFLMNTSRIHTEFRSLLQGINGGFQGEIDGLVIARIEEDLCSAALAIIQDNRWLLHSRNEKALIGLLDSIPRKYKPSNIEGETHVVEPAVEHARFKGKAPRLLRECIKLESSTNGLPHGPGGRHRLAQLTDIPRLEEYAVAFEKETGSSPWTDWENIITDKGILLGVYEGNVASVAVRGAKTLDQVLIEGVYTFPAFRRRGLAKRLVSALTQQATGKGQIAEIIVPKDNQAMLSLLENLHFMETSNYLVAKYK